jgi:signal transduction histidine kinase
VVLACLVAALSYLAAKLGGELIVRPQMVSPLWLGNVLLASLLLLVPRRIWPVLLVAGLAGFFCYDLQAGEPIRSIVSFILSTAVEVLTAVLCLSLSFDGVPRLNSAKALAKYSFFAVFLAPFAGAFFGAFSTSSHYWTNWKLAFFSEAIGFLTLMPAILGWAREIPTWAQKPRAHYLEATVLLVALVIFGHFAFATAGTSHPALLYSIVPLLLWATLRFGSTGVSTSMIALAFVSIWGAVHHRGPFTGPGPLVNVFSLQLFLFFTAAPFMALAAVAEESKDTEQALRRRDSELNEAQRLAHTGSWQWDPGSDAVTWSAELYRLARYDPGLPAPSFKDHERFFAPKSWDRLKQSVERTLRTGVPYELDLEAMSSDGTKLWLTSRGEAVVDANGHPIYLRGTTQDITDRKLTEEALLAMSGRLINAQEEERARIARELHDDLSQRMALLQIGLEQLKQGVPGLSSQAQQQLYNIAEIAARVSSDINGLSHQLHPSQLDGLGLVGSLRSLCKEFSGQHELQVQFLHSDIPEQIPKDVSLCLFRIAQEALRNVVKHSGAAEAEVELSGNADEIDLCISDSGQGFDAQSVKGVTGLGLISMRERLRLVGGHLSIESESSRGTRIRVSIPQVAITAHAGIRSYEGPNRRSAWSTRYRTAEIAQTPEPPSRDA